MNFVILGCITWCLIGSMAEEKKQPLEEHNLIFEIKTILESWISPKNELASFGYFNAFELLDPDWATVHNLKGCRNYRVNLL